MKREQPILPAHLATLAWRDRQILEDKLLAFDQGWHETRLAEAMHELPSDHGLRRAALLEMIKIDLERQWQRGRRTTLQHYLDQYPELGCAADLPPDLVRAEAEVQRQFNNQSETRPPSALFATLPVSFGRYRILKMLGQGAMGSVYLAHDPVLDREVALKVPHFGPIDGPETLARFTREAQAVSRLHHPNLCPVYDTGVCEQVPFITMAYLDGKPLSNELAASGPWPPAKALRLIHKLALALQAAHAQGVLHRDLKPANVMLNAAGEPILTDFGLARRWQQNDVRLTFPGSIVGTPAYMAPEQIAGT
ncbi:MAG TPA: serine/threonine-protein kinase, partial [Gemmataceae bacterium]|nr:serine/threonine-protein kinase [Gemmataceae bacterium]